MVRISPIRLHWIRDDGVDDPKDLCAHSPVSFEIDNKQLLTETDGDFTVSAASIYLLRTLEKDHILDSNTYENLFPCCGHSMYDNDGADVQIVGCSNGANFDVVRSGDSVQLQAGKIGKVEVPNEQWTVAVKAFADAVWDFYQNSKPKEPADDVASNGYNKMMAEWERRRKSMD